MTFGNILWILIFGAVVYYMMKHGGCCGEHDHHGEHKEHEGHGNSGGKDVTGHTHHHMVTDVSGTGTDKDPVCGMDVKDNRIESSHLGRTFHFCSEQCKKLFTLNPNKYTGA